MNWLDLLLCELAGFALLCELALLFAALLTTFSEELNVLCIFSSVNYKFFCLYFQLYCYIISRATIEGYRLELNI